MICLSSLEQCIFLKIRSSTSCVSLFQMVTYKYCHAKCSKKKGFHGNINKSKYFNSQLSFEIIKHCMYIYYMCVCVYTHIYKLSKWYVYIYSVLIYINIYHIYWYISTYIILYIIYIYNIIYILHTHTHTHTHTLSRWNILSDKMFPEDKYKKMKT